MSYTDTPPFTEPPDSEIRLPGETKGQGQRAVVEQVSTDFFSTMKIRIVRGRAFRNSDATGNRGGAVAVVSQTFARNFWSGIVPLGKVVLLPDGTRLLIVGVAADVESSNFDTPDEARLYVLQSPRAFTGFLLVRFEGPANSIGAEISRSIHSLDSTQTGSPVTLQSMRDEKAAHIRPLTELILFMAIVAVVLALSGLYGTVAFSMSQRTREFGIRMALGASKERILRSVLGTSARQIGIGLLFGDRGADCHQIGLVQKQAYGLADQLIARIAGEFAEARIDVGQPPPLVDLADPVIHPFDQEAVPLFSVRSLLPGALAFGDAAGGARFGPAV